MAAAIRARQRGLSVLVVEKNGADVMKPCGDGITKKSVSALAELGVCAEDLIAAGANIIRQSIHVHIGFQNRIFHQPGNCFTIRRSVLMQMLRGRAIDAGAVIRFNTPFSAETTGRNIIDASGCQNRSTTDGAHFPVGLSAVIQGSSALQTDTLYFLHHNPTDNGYCWAFPLSQGMWNVGIWQQKDCHGLRAAFASFEQNTLMRFFSSIHYVRTLQGAALGMVSHLRPICDGCVSCGDAAGLCDPFSGEGISFALMSGISAADSL